ncbi:hypothetical protein HOY82DRAFT_560570 [Tuber indicum]|nr:hypothetical protein HOY82DRAFT_560570 [Tuber indicum]
MFTFVVIISFTAYHFSYLFSCVCLLTGGEGCIVLGFVFLLFFFFHFLGFLHHPSRLRCDRGFVLSHFVKFQRVNSCLLRSIQTKCASLFCRYPFSRVRSLSFHFLTKVS